MQAKTNLWISYITMALVALPVMYFGLYCCMLERKNFHVLGVDPLTRQLRIQITPIYLIDSELFRRAIEPAHKTDRWLRSEFWTTTNGTRGGAVTTSHPPAVLPRSPARESAGSEPDHGAVTQPAQRTGDRQ